MYWRKHGVMLPGRRPAPGVTTIDDCALLPAGKDWDAIRVAEATALRAMEILGSRSGAVIEDPRSRAFYWFVAVGTAATWNLPGTKGLGEHRHVGVPPHGKVTGPGLRWRVTPGDGRLITDSGPLRAAIEDALAQEHSAAPAQGIAARRTGHCAAAASRSDDPLHKRCSGYLLGDPDRARCSCYCHKESTS